MNCHQPHSSAHRVPADLLRENPCDPRDPRSPMNPLAGIRATHRITLGYRHSSPDGDSPPFRITATYPVLHQSILNSSFLILNWSYTFSAKERDPETGLSYFGSRYYSSDLSVWLSVDPMSDKYPSTSPYAYCRNNPIRLIDPNGMFDDEAKATRLRNRAVKRYGEDRVSDVFNNTINGSKPDYAFSIYGKGKTKRSYSGGTNEDGGPVITCNKPDKVVFSRKDLKSYNRSQQPKYGVRVDASISFGAQAGDYIDIKGRRLGVDVNISSVDVAKLSISIDHDQPAAFDAHTISPNATQHNIGFRAGPISYDHTRNYYFDNLINETQTINVLGYNMYSSDPSMVVSVGLGARLGIGFDLKINLIRK